jgi:hypothetical protein
MEGDVVVVCPDFDRTGEFSVWVKGKTALETKEGNSIRMVSAAEVEAVLTNGFFAALRPARIAGSAYGWKASRRRIVDAAVESYRAGKCFISRSGCMNDVFRSAVGCSPRTDGGAIALSDAGATAPETTLVFSYARTDKGTDAGRFWPEMDRMRAMVEPGDVVAYAIGKPGSGNDECQMALYLGDIHGDGHPRILRSVDGAVRMSGFDTLFHNGSKSFLRKSSRIAVLRPRHWIH